ncbi:uncharacterized protein RCC_10977 [Ramularia collo-cygni]|uniref:Uncharacterized protein n=1 Tax=Ramularia collo-cygni TaxID=112498 RepID=A0A2D3VRZ3_9PEZI|nr:uncharacterized protein RCC_10977 [Ramularia collo-cygni]CZT25248.1 uncharacterized protein RCC_10977 [Ramularia collo-cygni]
MFLVRRRQQGKGPFPHKKVYPEVAWLYDPAPTPEGSVHKRDSGQEALLQPRHDEMEQAFLNHPGSPERAQATSPFLVPPRAYGGEESALGPAAWQQGGGTIRAVRRSSASAMVGERPAIFEGPHAR